MYKLRQYLMRVFDALGHACMWIAYWLDPEYIDWGEEDDDWGENDES